jgi:uncharacterized repeat protein (TIGR01451 family)
MVAVALVGILPALAFAGFSPGRPTYTIANPAPHVTFNSITDNPIYGDERAFFDVKNANNTSAGGFQDVYEVSPDETIKLRMYVHNNASRSLNESGVGIARDTKVRVLLPTDMKTNLRSIGYISASNAQPNIVSDTVDLYSDQAFSLEYVPGTARLQTNGGDFQLADSIVEQSGAQIGFDKLDGVVPGCFEYVGYVTLEVKVKTAQAEVEKTAREYNSGSTWQETVQNLAPGAMVEYRIKVSNTGNTNEELIVGDRLPANMSYVAGSTERFDSNGRRPANDGITSGGLNLGVYPPGGVAYVMFRAQVNHDIDACEAVSLVNTAFARTNNSPDVSDTATVVVHENCEEPVHPVYECTALNANPINILAGESVAFTVDATATPADQVTADSFTLKINGEDTGKGGPIDGTANHTFTEVGTYTVEATVTFTVNGETKTATSPACKVTITVNEQPDEPVYECTALTVSPVSGVKNAYRLNATASAAGGATINRYEFAFGDGATQTVTTDRAVASTGSHVYQPGDYTANVTVYFMVDGQEVSNTNQACEKHISVEEEPETPIYECTAVEAIQLAGGRKVRVTTTLRVGGGATLNAAVINFGDGESFTTNAATGEGEVKTIVTEHEYAQTGEYDVQVTVVFNVDDERKEVTCADTVKVTDKPVCEYNPNLSPDDPNCKKPTTPGVLPNTGPGAALMGIFGTSAIGAALQSYLSSRRALRGSLLSR